MTSRVVLVLGNRYEPLALTIFEVRVQSYSFPVGQVFKQCLGVVAYGVDGVCAQLIGRMGSAMFLVQSYLFNRDTLEVKPVPKRRVFAKPEITLRCVNKAGIRF